MADRRFPTNVEELDRYITEVMNENGFNQEDRSADGVPYSESVDGTMTMPLVRTDGEGNLIGYQQSPVSAIGVEALRGALINATGRYYRVQNEDNIEEHFYITFDRKLPSDAVPVFVRRMGHRHGFVSRGDDHLYKVTSGWKRYAYRQRQLSDGTIINPDTPTQTDISTKDYSKTTVLKLVATTKEGMYEVMGRDLALPERENAITMRQMFTKYFFANNTFSPKQPYDEMLRVYLNGYAKDIVYGESYYFFSWNNIGVAMCDKKGNYLSTIVPMKVQVEMGSIQSFADVQDNIRIKFG